jgi:uncharacterized DUF497 family protein
MAAPRFTWDSRKAAQNLTKHHVSFAEAQTVFEDDDALLIPDPDHSTDEDRYILLGLSGALRVLVVVHCEREDGDVIRIISARKATKSEQATYTDQRS